MTISVLMTYQHYVSVKLEVSHCNFQQSYLEKVNDESAKIARKCIVHYVHIPGESVHNPTERRGIKKRHWCPQYAVEHVIMQQS